VNDRLFEPARPSTTTVTATVVLRGPGGVTAVHCVLLTQETLVAVFEPKKKPVAAGVVSNPLPMIVTVVPPCGVPDEGEIDFSDGTKVKVADPVARRPLTVTVTVTLPTPAGDVARHWVPLEHKTLVAALGPKLTVVDPGTNPVPFKVTTVPPAAGPDVGEIEVRVAPPPPHADR
jgi:hypothetical protein